MQEEEPTPEFRVVPIRIDIEQGGGKFYIGPSPQELQLHTGDGVEWDFRYIGGADVFVQTVVIGFSKPAPFSRTSYRSAKPGGAKPHRLIAGPALRSAAGGRFEYEIRCLNLMKDEIVSARAFIEVVD